MANSLARAFERYCEQRQFLEIFHVYTNPSMACDSCMSLDLEKLLARERVPHHSTFRELEDCASTADCRLCQWVKEGLECHFINSGLQATSYNESKICCVVPPYVFNNAARLEKWHGISRVMFLSDVLNSFAYSGEVEIFVHHGNSTNILSV